MIYSVKPPVKPQRVEINLPASKSISNRMLLLRALSGQDFPIENLSDCDDTNVMFAALTDLPYTIDVGAAGTSMRFLVAYLSQLEGQEHVITGTARMLQRPILALVDALRCLGADIEYLGDNGFPPLKIKGKKLKCQQPVTMPGDVSSQYISAILMIAPLLETGLKLRLEGEVASKPYIQMTIRLMEELGAKVHAAIDYSSIQVEAGGYPEELNSFNVEADWSAAAFWFEISSLLGTNWNGYLSIKGLDGFQSLQGDSVVRKMYQEVFDVHYTSWADNLFVLEIPKDRRMVSHRADFSLCPDLAQALVVTCCMRNMPFLYTGLESLHIKETDRILALKTELAKLGFKLRGGDEDGMLMWQRGTCAKKKGRVVIDTYKDHRMAMSFAPCCIKLGEILINDPGVVSKSYPGFWDDLRKVGFIIEEVNE